MLNFFFCLLRSLQKMAIIVKSTLIVRKRKFSRGLVGGSIHLFYLK